MARQLAIAKRVSLAGIAEGWGDECFAMMLPATYPDMLQADDIDSKTKSDQVRFQLDFLKRHFVSGKIRVIGEDEPVDMEADDVDASVALTDRLFMACLGDDLDPKGAGPAPGAISEPENDDKPIETPSSTETATSLTSPPGNSPSSGTANASA